MKLPAQKIEEMIKNGDFQQAMHIAGECHSLVGKLPFDDGTLAVNGHGTVFIVEIKASFSERFNCLICHSRLRASCLSAYSSK